MRKYMCTLIFPEEFTEKFVKLIPKQRQVIVDLLAEGGLASFSLSVERSHAWMIVNADGLEEVEELLEGFPMWDFFEYEIQELGLHDIQHLGLPQLMLN